MENTGTTRNFTLERSSTEYYEGALILSGMETLGYASFESVERRAFEGSRPPTTTATNPTNSESEVQYETLTDDGLLFDTHTKEETPTTTGPDNANLKESSVQDDKILTDDGLLLDTHSKEETPTVKKNTNNVEVPGTNTRFCEAPNNNSSIVLDNLGDGKVISFHQTLGHSLWIKLGFVLGVVLSIHFRKIPPGFTPLSLWGNNFGYGARGWRSDKHPRHLVDVNSDVGSAGRDDVFDHGLVRADLAHNSLKGTGGGSGYSKKFMLINPQTGKALDVDGAKCSDGTNIHLWDINRSDAQIFHYHFDSKAIVNVKCNKAVDISRFQCNDGANIWLWKRNGSGAQKFSFYNDMTIRSAGCENKAIDIYKAASNNGANILSWSKHGNANQKWQIKYI